MDVAAGQHACDLSEGAAAGQYACDISEGCGGRSVCIRGMPLAACGVVRRTLGLALGLLLCEVVLDDGHHRALLARLVLEDPRLPLLGGYCPRPQMRGLPYGLSLWGWRRARAEQCCHE